MVVISLPAASATRLTQERIASPFKWTVHAPHCAIPQPYLVPVNESVSRSTQSSGVPGSTSTFIVLPLTFRVITRTLLNRVADDLNRYARTAAPALTVHLHSRDVHMLGLTTRLSQEDYRL